MIDYKNSIQLFNSLQKTANKPCNFKFSASANMDAYVRLIANCKPLNADRFREMWLRSDADGYVEFCDFIIANYHKYYDDESAPEEDDFVPLPPPESFPQPKPEPEPIPEVPVPVPAPQPVPVPQQSFSPTPDEVSNPLLHLSNLEKALAIEVIKNKGDWIRSQITGSLDEDIRKFIFDTYGPIKKKVSLNVDGVIIDMGEEILHERFNDVLAYVHENEPVFLTGPAGSGKSVLCQQVAKALQLDFYFSNAVTMEYKLTGFTDANGVYHETPFYKAFVNGGLFMLDEMDASSSDTLTILNAAIANKIMDFPAPIGNVKAHPNFRVIGAGNTIGLGADSEYVGRAQLDAATLDRFARIDVDYNSEIELAMANGDNDLVTFCHSLRQASKKSGIKFILSYRGIKSFTKLTPHLGKEKAMRSCIVKFLDGDDMRMLKSAMDIDHSNEYYKILSKLAKEA